MDTASYEIRIEQWIGIINEANASGMTKRSWCALNSISPRQFYYWQNKVRNYALTQKHSLSTDNQYDKSPCAIQKDKKSIVFCELPVAAKRTQISASNEPYIINAAFVPELVVQCGSFQLLLSHRTTEETLSTALSVLRHV